ncbi:MAG: DUF2125 domain-containing protein [Paracoccaceae bacterium]
MLKLLALVMTGAALWSGYWFVGARTNEQAMNTWFEERRDEGWQVEYSDLDLRGFPNRFDTTISDLTLTDPDTGLSWSTPFLQVLSLSYDPNHLIVVWPNDQTIATPYQKIDLTASKMRASVVLKPDNTLELDRANLMMEGVTLNSTEGWAATFDTLTAGIRETVDMPLSYDMAVEANKLVPGEALRNLLDQGGTLPDHLDAMRLDTAISFARPLDLRTIEEARPDITRIKVKDARGSWGELAVRASGEVDVDSTGNPTGELLVKAQNWREMLKMAVEAGAVPAEMESTSEMALGLLAGLSGRSDSIDAPLSFRNGSTYLGIIPIGDAPRLNLP